MSGSLMIVVADDESDTREYLRECLARLGHDVRAAENGRRLIELCREFPPDLVVTDYAMPGLDGLAATAEVNRDRRVPVILMSGRHEAESHAAAAGFVVAFLAKPVKEKGLKAAVESAAAGAAALRDTG